jgi:hypothetical protein
LGFSFGDFVDASLERHCLVESGTFESEKLVYRPVPPKHAWDIGHNLHFPNRPQKGKNHNAGSNIKTNIKTKK